jgi:hypothetical protein
LGPQTGEEGDREREREREKGRYDTINGKHLERVGKI